MVAEDIPGQREGLQHLVARLHSLRLHVDLLAHVLELLAHGGHAVLDDAGDRHPHRACAAEIQRRLLVVAEGGRVVADVLGDLH